MCTILTLKILTCIHTYLRNMECIPAKRFFFSFFFVNLHTVLWGQFNISYADEVIGQEKEKKKPNRRQTQLVSLWGIHISNLQLVGVQYSSSICVWYVAYYICTLLYKYSDAPKAEFDHSKRLKSSGIRSALHLQVRVDSELHTYVPYLPIRSYIIRSS